MLGKELNISAPKVCVFLQNGYSFKTLHDAFLFLQLR